MTLDLQRGDQRMKRKGFLDIFDANREMCAFLVQSKLLIDDNTVFIAKDCASDEP